MTVEGLIHNLTAFADFYEHASAEIERAQPYEKPYHRGGRDANADQMQRSFRATPGIDRVRAYVLARYGEDLTIATARRVLGDLIRVHKLSLEAAGALSLETAMDRMDALDGTERPEGGPLPTDPDPVPSGKAPIMPAAVRNWLTARYLADPTPGQWRFADGAEPEPIVFVRYEDFADYLLEAGFDLLPNLDTWKNAGWIEEVRVDLTPTENPTDHPPYALARLNLPVGRHRLTAIRGSVIDAPTSPEQSNLEVSGRMGELPTGKVRGVVSLNVLRAHLEMLGFPDWRERFQSWPEVPILRLRCAELFTGQPFTSETIELLMAWFQERGLTPDQARHLPLSEAVRRLSPPSKTGIGAGESSNPADPPTKPTPSLLDQAKQFLDQKDREIEARQVAAKLLPYYFFGPDGPYARASDPPASVSSAGENQSSLEAEKTKGEMVKSEQEDESDGPFGITEFRFAGVAVKFGRAGKQYRLVMALWDTEKRRPAPPRLVEAVISEVWGDASDIADSTFRQLCADTRRRFEAENCPLAIQQMNGKVQLSRL